MYKAEVEFTPTLRITRYCDTDRRFPGALVQGDTLFPCALTSVRTKPRRDTALP